MRRRVHRFLYLGLVALAGVPLAIACGQESVDIPDPEGPDTGVKTEAGADGDTTGEGGPDSGVDAADVTCADVLPDDTMGIYVTPTGTNSGTCGTRAAPCKTITFSVTRAGVALRSKVYAARGTYAEKVTLAAGVEVVGGWEVTGSAWKRACVAPEEAVVVRAPAGQSITVEARDLGGEARLTLLKIDSKLPAQVVPGESLYGVVAVGATTTLVLDNVIIDMGNAPDGAAGSKGDAGIAAPASCAPSTGAAGANGTVGTGAPAGTFDPTNEYTPGTATGGTPGTAGTDGTAGGAGTCVDCGSCTAFPACIFIGNGAQNCGKEGSPGCAGGPGGPGFPATSGGANIALFAWDANVTVNGGKLKSGNAGNGGAGGAVGAAGASTNGAKGADSDPCITACSAGAAACVVTMAKGTGGTAGGRGGAAGLGGPGGGGGGGSSFAIYQGGAGLVTTTPSTTLAHGTAGKGGGPDGGAGAPGAAANRVP